MPGGRRLVCETNNFMAESSIRVGGMACGGPRVRGEVFFCVGAAGLGSQDVGGRARRRLRSSTIRQAEMEAWARQRCT